MRWTGGDHQSSPRSITLIPEKAVKSRCFNNPIIKDNFLSDRGSHLPATTGRNTRAKTVNILDLGGPGSTMFAGKPSLVCLRVTGEMGRERSGCTGRSRHKRTKHYGPLGGPQEQWTFLFKKSNELLFACVSNDSYIIKRMLSYKIHNIMLTEYSCSWICNHFRLKAIDR